MGTAVRPTACLKATILVKTTLSNVETLLKIQGSVQYPAKPLTAARFASSWCSPFIAQIAPGTVNVVQTIPEVAERGTVQISRSKSAQAERARSRHDSELHNLTALYFNLPTFMMDNSSSTLARDDLATQTMGWSPLVITLVALYAVLCSFLRYQRRDSMHKKLGFPDRRPLSSMTNVEAQSITAYLSELEFPKLYYTSVQFALFKTYGIPTISSLLLATKEFSTPTNACKRYADTEILIQEFTNNHPESDRVLKALARVNYIHSGYQKAGKISNADMLYTLSVFITEPINWVKKYEWREMTDMELCAIGVLWQSIGEAMNIQYEGYLSKSKWKDGLEFYHDISEWAAQYEEKYMVPAESNKKVADELMPLLLFFVPKSARGPAHKIVGYLMGDRLRKSMMYPAPTEGYALLASTIFTIRKLVLCYLSLPRPNFLRVHHNSDPDPKTGRYYWDTYFVQPFYNKPGFMNRWGPEAWFVKAFGGNVPGDKGSAFIPEGYSFEEMGPKGMKGKGIAEMKATQERLKSEWPLGCPVAFRG